MCTLLGISGHCDIYLKRKVAFHFVFISNCSTYNLLIIFNHVIHLLGNANFGKCLLIYIGNDYNCILNCFYFLHISLSLVYADFILHNTSHATWMDTELLFPNLFNEFCNVLG